MMHWTKMLAIVVIMTVAGAALTATALPPHLASSSAEPPFVVSMPSEEPATAPTKKEEKKAETELETILRQWAEADKKVREMQVRFTSTAKDPTFDTTETTKGHSSLKKPDLWRVDRLDKDGRKLEVLLLESKRIHLFHAENKTERICAIPEGPLDRSKFLGTNLGSLSEQLHWSAFGPQARDMDSRYKLRLAKQDQWYVYLDIEPRNKKRSSWFEWFPDRWFERARIVLEKKDYQVRQVWFEHANRNEILVDFLDRRINPKEPITRESLLKGLPKGWKREEMDDADKTKK